MKKSNSSAIQRINKYKKKMKDLEKTYLGFPNNMAYDYRAVSDVSSVYLNNAGDPFSALSWKKHSKEFEQEVVNFFLDLYKLDREQGWGYITSGGTEGNMQGMFLARERLEGAEYYFLRDSHYSIAKICRILNVKFHWVNSLPHGEMDYVHFGELLKKKKSKKAVVVVNCGTTVKGAADNLEKIQNVLDTHGIDDRHIHVDAALSGMIVPFIEGAPFYSFETGIDSVAISTHKFLGSPLIAGIVLVRKSHVSSVGQKIEYINSRDTTILGSRSGHAPLYAWYAITHYGRKRLAEDARVCVENAHYLENELNKRGYDAHVNPYANTVYFPVPCQKVVDKWQLSCSGGIAHVITMQHVKKHILDDFLLDMGTHKQE